MIQPGYYNLLAASFGLFTAHELEYYWGSYTNYSGILYPTTAPQYSQYDIWASPFRQFVSDMSVTGATQISGVYQGSDFVARGTSGLAIDFNMARVLVSGSGLSNPTAAYAFRDFSIYYTTQSEPELLIENVYEVQPSITQITGALFWNQQTVPAIFIKNNFTENTPWAFGGTDLTKTTMTCIVLSDSQYKLDACCGALADTARKYFPLFPVESLPFGVLGDYKDPVSGYNYINLCNNYTGFLVFIDKVRVSKFSENNNKRIGKTIFAALVDFELQFARDPRRR
jgi:hypothetical protein